MITNQKLNLLAVGLFVVFITASLLAALAFITGRTGATDHYQMQLDDVTGVKFGTQIIYQGYNIGQVEAVEPFDDKGVMRFRIELAITKGWRIPADSVASIGSPSLLAAKTISIKAGSSKESIAVGGHINSSKEASLFGALDKVAAQFSELNQGSLIPLLQNLDTQIGAAGQLIQTDLQAVLAELGSLLKTTNEQLPGVLADIKAISGDVAAKEPALMADLQRLARDLRISGSRVKQMVSHDNVQEVDALLANLYAASQQLEAFSGQLNTLAHDNKAPINAVVLDLRRSMAALAAHMDGISSNAETATRNFAEFSRQIRSDPSVLLGGREQGED